MEHEHGHETPTQHEIHHAQHEKGIGCQSLDGHETTFSNGEKEQGHILGSQNETTEKEGTMNSSCNTGTNVQVRYDVGKIQSEQSEDCHDVANIPQAPKFSGTEQRCNSHEPQQGLPRRDLDGRGGSEPAGKSPISQFSAHDSHETSQYLHFTSVGTTGDSVGQACRQDVHGSSRGSGLCSSDLEQKGSVKLASQLPNVLPNVPEVDAQYHDGFRQRRTSRTNDEHLKPVAGSHSVTDQDGHQSRSRNASASTIVDLPTKCDRMDTHRSSNGTVKSCPEERKQDCRGITNEHRGQSAESSSSADADCHSPAGTGQRASDPRRQQRREDAEMIEAAVKYIESDEPMQTMSVDQEGEIHQAIQKCILQVEDGLSRLPQKMTSFGLRENPSNMVKLSTPGSQQSRPLDLLEVYCGDGSQITHQINRRGGRAMRFTKHDGDLNTETGIQKLWLWIYMYEPRHVWLAPECRLYGKFANLNMCRSLQAFQKTTKERENNRGHLWLCNEIFLHQVSLKRHAHLEQPAESCMTKQREMQELVSGTYEACFDMCRLGKLKLPHQDQFLRKRTKVRTTSGYFHYHLHDQRCKGEHDHATIQGSIRVQGKRENVSAYAAAYTPVFGTLISKLVLEECKIQEPPVMSEIFALSEEHVRSEMAPEDTASPKRQRYGIKRPPRMLDLEHELRQYGRSPTWSKIIQRCNSDIPRVGNLAIRAMFPQFQMMVPEMTVKLILICRGTERFRVPGAYARGEDMPWRKTILVDRGTGEIVDKGPPENWKSMPKLQQTRKAGSARMSISLFGTKSDGTSDGIASEPQNPPNMGDDRGCDWDMEGELGISSCRGDGGSDQNPPGNQPESIVGWPPKIVPRSGPHFEALEETQKSDLRRIHSNLGHPSPEKLSRMLQEQGASDAVIKAARDYQCDSCIESQPKPRLPNPSTIHVARDFNDVIGADGAYWTNRQGRTFHFMHFIDESTLYHLGNPSGRTVQEQIETFENTWLHWAGPCKLLYLDPAGEYIMMLGMNSFKEKESNCP